MKENTMRTIPAARRQKSSPAHTAIRDLEGIVDQRKIGEWRPICCSVDSIYAGHRKA